ncbi:hypothetical protein FQA39_LY03269 [Lamprigera yunnana]|nr:hypothetical protein FQA39_LY03269 [Lamprigera yunnana]
MDLSLFKLLKLQYDEAIMKWQRENYGIRLPKSMFSSIISRIWEELRSKTTKSGIRKRFKIYFAENSSLRSLVPSVDDIVADRGCSEATAHNPATSDTTTTVHASDDNNVDNTQEEAEASLGREKYF